jgi:hypothetical protein
MTRERILVAMSGGDSAAAAAVLVEAGHEVVGPRSALVLRRCGRPRPGLLLAPRHRGRTGGGGRPRHLATMSWTRRAFDTAVVRPLWTLSGRRDPQSMCSVQYPPRSGPFSGGRGLISTRWPSARCAAEDDLAGPVLRRAVDRAKDQSYVQRGLEEDLALARFPLGTSPRRKPATPRATGRAAGGG